MEAKDLMIGDWVKIKGDYGKPLKITIIDEPYDSINYFDGDAEGELTLHLNEIEPIFLTPEILKKNGFENGKLNISPQYYLEYNNVFIGVTLKDIPDKHKGIDITKGKLFFQYDISYIEEPIYVHQLQHALRLCGIEKEIEL